MMAVHGLATPGVLVGEHHERLDGGGYPSGLTADELALGPRILAACEVFDALVSDRVYSEAWSTDRGSRSCPTSPAPRSTRAASRRSPASSSPCRRPRPRASRRPARWRCARRSASI
jgi:hypothetical protein